MQKIKNIDVINYLRGFAIFTIVTMHLVQQYCTGTFSKLILWGGAGVHVFFLISGFGLYYSHLHKPLKFISFLRKRFSKIYIPYFIMVLFWCVYIFFDTHNFPLKELLSHIFLYKMFSPELDVSLCYHYWFISSIIQFYLTWNIIVKLFKMRKGLLIAFLISIAWWVAIYVIGYDGERNYASFFLQYLWEFCLGMWIAQKIYKNGILTCITNNLKKIYLLFFCIIGSALSAIMAWSDGFLKIFNDVPSLIGYISGLLFIYSLNIRYINRFFSWSSSFSYELYLVHSFVFVLVYRILPEKIPIMISILLNLFFAYIIAYCFSLCIKHFKTFLIKSNNKNVYFKQ